MVAPRSSHDTQVLLRWRLLLISLFVLAGLFFFAAKPALASPTTPPDFADTLVTNVGSPTALAFTPDGRMLISTQSGKLRVYKDGSLLVTPALDLAGKICTNSERGLLGVAVDPRFLTNNYVYLYYTTNENGGCVNRVARYTLSGDDKATFDKVLIDNIHSTAGNHNAGDLHFGKDGYLYVSVGDGGCDYAGGGCAGSNDAARDQHVLLGKILRVTPDGDIPATNPYRGSDSARCNTTGRTDPGKKCQETFASGLRNPFRMAFDPNTAETRFFINDVGQNAWEEVDEGKVGADYGWNLCEGNHDNPNRSGSVNCGVSPYTPPIHEYNHNTGCGSITGGAFVPNGIWPTEYDGSYLFGDYVCGKIFKLTPRSGGGYDRTEFVTGLGSSSAVAMTFGPYASGQSLYYTTYAGGGQVRRIDYTGSANHAPTAAVTANPTSGLAPLTVAFDGSGSRDQDPGDTLTYLWDFGDGTATEPTTTPTTNHTYAADGTYTATLRVRDDSGATSAPATVRIDVGNRAPEPKIEAPTAGALFRVGQEITLTGSATDPEDGPLPDSSLSWKVIRHHNDSHTHPVLQPTTGNDLTFSAPPPEDLFATGEGNYLEIQLTATDSGGATRIVTQILQPKRVSVTFKTAPKGRELEINGTTIIAPKTLISWEGYELDVFAPTQENRRGKTIVFRSWSDGGADRHKITTPASPATYKAKFRRPR